MIAVDPAAFGGDRTGVAISQETLVDRVLKLPVATPMETAGHLIRLTREIVDRRAIDPTDLLANAWQQNGSFLIDVAGMGQGIANRLTEQGYAVVPFRASTRPDDPKRSGNKKG